MAIFTVANVVNSDKGSASLSSFPVAVADGTGSNPRLLFSTTSTRSVVSSSTMSDDGSISRFSFGVSSVMLMDVDDSTVEKSSTTRSRRSASVVNSYSTVVAKTSDRSSTERLISAVIVVYSNENGSVTDGVVKKSSPTVA